MGANSTYLHTVHVFDDDHVHRHVLTRNIIIIISSSSIIVEPQENLSIITL